MYKMTDLASGAITAVDTVTIELGEAVETPAIVIVRWPVDGCSRVQRAPIESSLETVQRPIFDKPLSNMRHRRRRVRARS
jgi:hypothetical protein